MHRPRAVEADRSLESGGANCSAWSAQLSSGNLGEGMAIGEQVVGGIAGVTFVDNGPVDVGQLNTLYKLVGWDRSDRRTREETTQMLHASRFFVSAHSVDLGLVGFARVCGDPYVAQVLDVMTHPEQRRRGIATECMRRIVEHLCQTPYVNVTLTAGVNLGDFYERFGFKTFKDVARVWSRQG